MTEQWLQKYKTHFTEFIGPLSSGGPLLRWVGVFLAIMAAGSFTLLFSMLLLVWKVNYGCVQTQSVAFLIECRVLRLPALRH